MMQLILSVPYTALDLHVVAYQISAWFVIWLLAIRLIYFRCIRTPVHVTSCIPFYRSASVMVCAYSLWMRSLVRVGIDIKYRLVDDMKCIRAYQFGMVGWCWYSK